MEADEYDSINFKEILLVLLNKKKFISITTFFFTTIFLVVALNLPNIYTSKSILIPSSDDESLSSKLGGFSSLASISGINMSSIGTSKSQEAIKRIKSFEFFSTHFLPNIKLEDIFAVKKWLPDEDILIYDDALFDDLNKKWVRKANYPRQEKPSAQEAYKIYSKIVTVNEDNMSLFVTITVEHHSPIIAKNWVNLIINKINESMRENDEEIAKKSISFLNKEFQDTKITSIKEAISILLQNQMQTLMLTASNDAYVYKVIDSAIAPEEESRPNRVLIVVLGAFLGMIFSVLIVVFRSYKSTF